MWNQPPATPRRGASNGTAEGLWEHRFQSASSWDELVMWDSGEGQSSGGGYREPALSITVLAASRTTPTWEGEHQASTWALSLTAAPLNGTTFSLSPDSWTGQDGWFHLGTPSHPAPATSPATNQGLYQSLLAHSRCIATSDQSLDGDAGDGPMLTDDRG